MQRMVIRSTTFHPANPHQRCCGWVLKLIYQDRSDCESNKDQQKVKNNFRYTNADELFSFASLAFFFHTEPQINRPRRVVFPTLTQVLERNQLSFIIRVIEVNSFLKGLLVLWGDISCIAFMILGGEGIINDFLIFPILDFIV